METASSKHGQFLQVLKNATFAAQNAIFRAQNATFSDRQNWLELIDVDQTCSAEAFRWLGEVLGS